MGRERREYRRALDLNPSYATGHHWYAFTLLQLERRWDEAIWEITVAAKLDPFSQIIALNKAKILFWAGRREEAIVQFRLALDLNPDSAFARAELGMAMVYNSSIDEGTAEIENALNREHQGPSSAKLRLALAYGMANRKTEAENLLREAKKVPSGTYVPGTIIAMIYAVLGEKGLAFESLYRAVRDGTSTIVVLSEPIFDDLRTDPRFHEILEKVGLA